MNDGLDLVKLQVGRVNRSCQCLYLCTKVTPLYIICSTVDSGFLSLDSLIQSQYEVLMRTRKTPVIPRGVNWLRHKTRYSRTMHEAKSRAANQF